MRAARQRGLSMIEVLAAMVIFASSAVVLFGWIGQTADRLGKLRTEQRQLLGQLTALDFLRGLNPMATPSGQTQLGDWALSWEAQPLNAGEMVRNEAGSAGAFQVQLFKVQASLRNTAGLKAEQSLVLAGWRQVKDTHNGMPFAR